MKFPTVVLVILILSSSIFAQEKVLPLWKNGAPGAKGKKPEDTPTLTPFLVKQENNTKAAIIICPGGGNRVVLGPNSRQQIGDRREEDPKIGPSPKQIPQDRTIT